jgi:hypothetical protein
MPALHVDPLLIWGLIPRFIGLLYVIAFGGLAPQIVATIGAHGIGPVAPRLAQARRDYPGFRRFTIFPSVLWISSSDRTLRMLPWIGVAAGVVCMVGGPYAVYAQILAVVLWRSLEPAALIYPWDTMLMEAGFLTLFLPQIGVLPSIQALHAPYPSVVFMVQFLVLRLMLGFGKVKFIGTKREDSLYLRGFFAWSSVTPGSWFAHHLPAFVLRAMLLFMFVGEVVAPVLGFIPGTPRVISFALLVMLMIGIQSTGNWGYFNLGYALLCLCLLDTSASLADLWHEPFRAGLLTYPDLALNTLMGVLFATGLLYLVGSESWSSRTSVHWPFDDVAWNRPWLRGLLAYLRALSPLRIVNGYGVFPPSAQPPMLQVPTFEGSHDGVTWKPYRYRFLATSATQAPCYFAPYHPRLDMGTAYTATCVYDGSLYGSLISDGTPYGSYARSSWLERTCQRLLEGDAPVLSLFGENPFAEAPPSWMRVCTLVMTPTTLEMRRRTGHWWHVRRLGLIVQPMQKESWPDALGVPEPEVFHPDWVEYRRHAAPLKAIGAAFRAGEAPSAAIVHASDFTPREVRRFWDEFVPQANQQRGQFERHVECARALEVRFGMEQVARFERILERYAWLLRLRTERHQFADATPNLPIKSNFRYHLFLQELVMDGEAAYLGYLDDVARVVERFASSTDETQIWTLALLRNHALLQHIAAFRWTMVGVDLHRGKVRGLFEYHPLISKYAPPGEEYRPEITKHENGEHTIVGLYPPPAFVEGPAE